MSAFYEPGNLADVIQTFQRNARGAIPNRFVQKLTVRTRHLGHKKVVKRIHGQPATRVMFDCEELGGRVSVADYFRQSLYSHLSRPPLSLTRP
jgi:eukaryotic translation initiation factor 2C